MAEAVQKISKQLEKELKESPYIYGGTPVALESSRVQLEKSQKLPFVFTQDTYSYGSEAWPYRLRQDAEDNQYLLTLQCYNMPDWDVLSKGTKFDIKILHFNISFFKTPQGLSAEYAYCEVGDRDTRQGYQVFYFPLDSKNCTSIDALVELALGHLKKVSIPASSSDWVSTYDLVKNKCTLLELGQATQFYQADIKRVKSEIEGLKDAEKKKLDAAKREKEEKKKKEEEARKRALQEERDKQEAINLSMEYAAMQASLQDVVVDSKSGKDASENDSKSAEDSKNRQEGSGPSGAKPDPSRLASNGNANGNSRQDSGSPTLAERQQKEKEERLRLKREEIAKVEAELKEAKDAFEEAKKKCDERDSDAHFSRKYISEYTAIYWEKKHALDKLEEELESMEAAVKEATEKFGELPPALLTKLAKKPMMLEAKEKLTAEFLEAKRQLDETITNADNKRELKNLSDAERRFAKEKVHRLEGRLAKLKADLVNLEKSGASVLPGNLLLDKVRSQTASPVSGLGLAASAAASRHSSNAAASNGASNNANNGANALRIPAPGVVQVVAPLVIPNANNNGAVQLGAAPQPKVGGRSTKLLDKLLEQSRRNNGPGGSAA